MDGKSYQKITSKAFPTSIGFQITELILLAGIGALGVLIHAYLRTPLKLPGHNGVFYMALLLSGRLLSNKKFASSYSSIGAAFMLLLPLGFKDPFMPVIYFFPGFVVDFMYNQFKTFRTHPLLLATICGLAYFTIPLTRIVIQTFTGFPYGSLTGGFIYPFITHFIFGFTGGLIPAGISFLKKRKKQ